MPNKLASCYGIFSKHRDLSIISTTVTTGALIGLGRSINKSVETIQCNMLCDSAYGAYTGILLAFLAYAAEKLLKSRQNTPQVNYNNLNDAATVSLARP